jgi:hypothetical protein
MPDRKLTHGVKSVNREAPASFRVVTQRVNTSLRFASTPETALKTQARVASKPSRPSQVEAAARVINLTFPHPGKAPVPRIAAGSFVPATHLPDKPDAVVEPAKTQADSTSPPRKFACVPHRLASTGCAGAQADTEAGQAAALTCPQQFVNPTAEVAYEEKYQVEKNCNAKKGKDAENVGSSRGSNPGSSSDSERSNPGVAKADSAKVQVCGGAGVQSFPPHISSERVSRRPALSLLLICEQSPRSPR